MLVFAGQIPVVKREGILCNLRCIYRGNCVCVIVVVAALVVVGETYITL